MFVSQALVPQLHSAIAGASLDEQLQIRLELVQFAIVQRRWQVVCDDKCLPVLLNGVFFLDSTRMRALAQKCAPL